MSAEVTKRNGARDLTDCTRLMRLSCVTAAHAMALYGTKEVKRGMQLMETADQISEAAGAWATRCGYTLGEITAPLWRVTGTSRRQER